MYYCFCNIVLRCVYSYCLCIMLRSLQYVHVNFSSSIYNVLNYCLRNYFASHADAHCMASIELNNSSVSLLITLNVEG